MLVHVDLSEGPLMPKAAPKEMISVVKDGSLVKVRINSSSVGVIQECQRKAQLSLLEGWKLGVEHPATLFGSAIHKALEVFYCGKVEERILPSLEQLELMSYGHKIATEGGLIERATRAFIEKAKPLEPLPAEDRRSIQNGVWILWHYFRSYLNDPYVALVDDAGPFVERSFTMPIYRSSTLEIDYFGTIDFAFRHSTTGHILLGDHKTTSVLAGYGDTGSYFERDRPNSQYCGYLLAAREVYGYDVNEFLVNVIEVKARPKTSRGKAEPSFPRQITSRDADDYAEFREVVLDTTLTYLRNLDRGVWPLGPVSACTNYGACTYKQVCGSPKSLRENILRAKFNQEKQP